MAFRSCLPAVCAFILLVSLSSASAQEITIELAPSTDLLDGCSGDELTVNLRFANSGGLEVGGYQVFLKYPAEYFEPVRFEPSAISSFTGRAGPAPFGSGFEECPVIASDPWDDGLGEDVVAVFDSVFAQDSPEPWSDLEGDIGQFVFRTRGRATPPEGASFLFNQTACHPAVDQTSKVFSPSGAALPVSTSGSFTVSVQESAATVEDLTCVDFGSVVQLFWRFPPVEGVIGSRIYRNGEVLARVPLPSITDYTDDEPPTGDVLYEVAVLLDGNLEGCRAACLVSRTGATFIRGDANSDGGVNVSDPIAILEFLFGGVPIPCPDAGGRR